jgi:hypothetical protein
MQLKKFVLHSVYMNTQGKGANYHVNTQTIFKHRFPKFMFDLAEDFSLIIKH